MAAYEAPVSVALAQPDEPGGLQILSDWYEEQGDPRGEITRLCSELATYSTADPRHSRLMTRLWNKNNYYLGYLRRKESDIDCHIALGNQQSPFDSPFKIIVTAAELLRRGDYLLEALPPLYDLDIRGEPEDLAALARLPLARGIVGIGHLDISLQESHAELFESPHLNGLQRLDIFSEYTLEVACRSRRLKSIRKLAFKRHTTSACLEFLRSSTLLAALKRIEFDSPVANEDSYVELWRETLSACELTSLGLGRFSQSQLSFPVEELFSREVCQSLRWLCFNSEFDPTGLLQNSLANNTPDLKKLTLQKSNWQDPSRLVLLERLPALRWLVVAESNLGNEAAELWARLPLQDLQYLDLSKTNWNDAAVHMMLAGEPWPRLETLLLQDTPITGAAAELLAKSWRRTFPRLKRLVVGPFEGAAESIGELRDAIPFVEVIAPTDFLAGDR